MALMKNARLTRSLQGLIGWNGGKLDKLASVVDDGAMRHVHTDSVL